MKLTSSKALSFVAITALAGTASAGSVVVSTLGPGGAIPNDAGTSGGDGIWFDPAWNSFPTWGVLVTSVDVPYAVDQVTSIVIGNLQHDVRGDLHIYLENPAGNRFNIVVRPGSTGNELPTPFGDQGDFVVGNYTIVESGGGNLAQGDANLNGGTYNQYLNSGPGAYANPALPIFNLPLSQISGTAGTWKLYVRDWGGVLGQGAIASWRLIGENNGATGFCFGDGTQATACPCGNEGEPGHGCANTFYPSGGHLAGFGFPLISFDNMVLDARDMTGNVAVFFQGSLAQPALAIDDGLGCVGGNIIRLGTKAIESGVSMYPGPGDDPISVKGQLSPFSFTTRYYQAMYRNANPAFCTPATTNRTNGVIINWIP